MKALLLAAGYGKRLGQLTESTPKPLIQIGDIPILEFCLQQLESIEVEEVVINAHYLSNQLEEYLERYKGRLRIEISIEETLLGTAGTLKRHFHSMAQNDFLVMHADNYFADSLRNFMHAHQNRLVGSFGSMGLFLTSKPEDCGVVLLKEDGTVAEFYEKVIKPPSNLANAAIYVFTNKIETPLFQLSDYENDISRDLIPKLIPNLSTYVFSGLFVDIGTPEGLQIAIEARLKSSRAL